MTEYPDTADNTKFLGPKRLELAADNTEPVLARWKLSDYYRNPVLTTAFSPSTIVRNRSGSASLSQGRTGGAFRLPFNRQGEAS